LTNIPSTVAGHPKVQKAAVFDIITPDLLEGPMAAGAEVLAVAEDCLNSFPSLAQNYDIHISHSNSTSKAVISKVYILNRYSVVDLALSRIPAAQRSAVIDIIHQSKSSPSQKRALLLKKGLLRSIADELEAFAETGKSSFLLSCMVFRLFFYR